MKPLSDFFFEPNVKDMGPDMIAPAAKKLWDKGPGAGGDSKGPPHLPPLQLNPEQMWRDPTWSAQAVEHNVGVPMMGTRRGVGFPGGDAGSILSPRDTAGLGVKMVEYVLGGSPTEGGGVATGGGGEKVPGVVAGLRGMVLEERPEDKSSSPFEKDLHELHDHGGLPNGLHNGQEDDKAFNRTPGSRQPSPAEEEVGGAGAVRNGEAAAYPLMAAHALPAAPAQLHHLAHLPHHQHPQHPHPQHPQHAPHPQHPQHPQHHPGMLGVPPLQGLPHPQHPQLHPGMTLNDSMNQHIELVLQMEQHPQFDNNSFATTQQYAGGVGGVGGVGGGKVSGYSQQQQPPYDAQDSYKPGGAYSGSSGKAGGGGAELGNVMYNKTHVALNKVNSYEKAAFHSGTPPPFGAGSHLYIPAPPHHHPHHHAPQQHQQESGAGGGRSAASKPASSKPNYSQSYWAPN